MRTPAWLRHLDDRFVPGMARQLDKVVPRPPEPSGPLPFILRLRRIDDRWTSRGPLALLREVPQLGALAIAGLVLASGVTVASRERDQRAPGNGATGEQVPGPKGDEDGRVAIGPQLGDSVAAYLDATQQRLIRVAAGQPDAEGSALVAFEQYRTPLQVRELLGPATQVVRIFYRAPLPLPQTEWQQRAVGDVVTDSRKEFLRRAIVLEREAAALQSVIDTNDHDPVQKKADEDQASVYRREAKLLKGDCACIYAVVVQTRMRVLIDVSRQPGVRVVDAGAPGVNYRDYTFTALLPEEKVTVTGGNQA